VPELTPSPFAAWETFYVIVGSSGAALTGLQFVVIALVAETKRQSTTREIDAFATPTIVHFGSVLLLSAILSAPWHGLATAALVLGIAGAVGVSYAALVVRRMFRPIGYQPVAEDWVFHAALPVVAYGAIVYGAVTLNRDPRQALFVIAAMSLLLLFIGMHNAWDTVTYIAVEGPPHRGSPDAANPPD
jgi:hypothetical protein